MEDGLHSHGSSLQGGCSDLHFTHKQNKIQRGYSPAQDHPTSMWQNRIRTQTLIS